MARLFRLTGWTIYWDDNTMTFRHRCGWEVYANDLDTDPVAGTAALIQLRDHVC